MFAARGARQALHAAHVGVAQGGQFLGFGIGPALRIGFCLAFGLRVCGGLALGFCFFGTALFFGLLLLLGAFLCFLLFLQLALFFTFLFAFFFFLQALFLLGFQLLAALTFALFTLLLFGTLALFLLQPLFLALDGNVRFAGVRLFLRPWWRWGRRRHHGSGWRRRLCGRGRRRRWGRGHECGRGLLRNR